jgi:hypothetical protein
VVAKALAVKAKVRTSARATTREIFFIETPLDILAE